MPAGGRVKVSIGIIESNTDRPTGVSGPAFRGKDRQHHCCASHDRVDRSTLAVSQSRAKAQPQTDNLGSLEVAGGQGGWMLFAHQPAMPAAIVGRRKRTGRARPAKATSKEGASSQQGAAPQHLQRSFTARQIGTASNEAFVRFDKKKISRKKKSGLRHSTF